MLTYEDCVGLSNLTVAEIDAIAEHEHVPYLVALELGNYLSNTCEGERCIERMICEDIAHASDAGNWLHVATLKLVLRQYLAEHPA